MKVLFFSSDKYIQDFVAQVPPAPDDQLDFTCIRLDHTTVTLAQGYEVISCFIYDQLDKLTLTKLHDLGIKCIALRSAGYNNVDLTTAKALGLTVVHAPTYSPYAVAEHAATLIMALNRKIPKAYLRVRDGNFSLHNLLGFELHSATVGVIGTGKIGTAFTQIMKGFGCRLLGYDKITNPECLSLAMRYVTLEELLAESDIISLHCPLTPDTQHLINATNISLMRPGVMLINTSRGELIDTKAVIRALKAGKIGYLGLDVYEAESQLFFCDLSGEIIQDDTFSRLQTFPNVLITGHQGFLTKQAYADIARITLANIQAYKSGKGLSYQL